MRLALVFVVFAFISIKSFCQSTLPRTVLGVEKEYLTSKKAFIFKPHSFLKIKTENGRKFQSARYSFTDEFIVMNKIDTIRFENIVWIQGRVYGNKDRKFGGAVIAFCSVPASVFPIFYISYGGGPIFLAAAPFIGMMYGGIRFTGARKFRKAHSCFVKTFDQ